MKMLKKQKVMIHTGGDNGHSKTTKTINQPQQQAFLVKEHKFNNPLISVADLDTNCVYQPEIINNITKIKETDHWFCL